jgi:GGDEF domain-containing protein
MEDGEDASVMDAQTGLPNRDGWEAVLEAEEERSRRHGGIHGLVLVRLEVTAAHDASAAPAADAIGRSLREIDLLARIDHQTFAVLALHCDDLERVVGRLRTSLERAGVRIARLTGARAAGADLRATWSAMATGSPPVAPTVRHIAFVASPPTALN